MSLSQLKNHKIRNTNCCYIRYKFDPEGIDFPTTRNDDARRSIDLYCNLLKETINNAKKDLPKLMNLRMKINLIKNH